MAAVSPWINTGRALLELKQLLICKRWDCAVSAVNIDSKCPTCGSFAWVTDLKVNRQLANTVTFCTELEKLIAGTESSEKGLDTSANSLDSSPSLDRENEYQHTGQGPSPSKDAGLGAQKQVCEALDSSLSSWCAKPTKGPRHTYGKKIFEKPKTACKRQLTRSAAKEHADTDAIFNQEDQKVDGDQGSNSNISVTVKPSSKTTRERRNQPKRAKSEISSPVKQPTPVKKSNLRVSTKSKPWTEKICEPTTDDQRGSKTSTPCKAKDTPPLKNLEKKNKRGETPLHIACIKGDEGTVESLLKNGADPNTKDFAGWTPLHEASNHGFTKVVELLIDHGALINMPGLDHDTPLHDAVANHRVEVVTALLRRGALTTMRNKNGQLPVDYARTTEMKNLLTTMAGFMSEKTAEDTVGPASRPRSSEIATKVLLSTGLSNKEKVELTKCAKLLKAKVVDEFNSEVTHVIAAVNERNVCSRTIKYLMGVVQGKWIVSFAWIKQSLKLKTWQQEEDFEVSGTEDSEQRETPKRARVNDENQFPRLFDGCSFYLYGTFSSPKREEVLQFIKGGDGKILTREPKVDDDFLMLPDSSSESKLLGKQQHKQSVAFHAKPSSGLSVCTQYIVYDSNSKRQPKVLHSPILATVPVAWLLECISLFEIVKIKDSYVDFNGI